MKTCAVIVTYFPSAELLENVRRLISQVDEIVIVDNDSQGESKQYIEQLVGQEKITLLLQNQNWGIAKALNLAAEYALERGYSWLATFDQDSQVSVGYIAGLLEMLQHHPQPQHIAILAPQYFNPLWAKNKSMNLSRSDSGLYQTIPTTWTSGNLLNLQAWRAVKGFREGFFVDYADLEFCLRLRRAGWLILESTQVVLQHRLGNPSAHWVGGIRVLVTHYSPLRRYYKTRNALVLYKENLLPHPGFVLRNALALGWETLKMLIWEQQRRVKLTMMLRGVLDALQGRMGRYGA